MSTNILTYEEYQKLSNELDKEFPNSPFIINCIENLDELNKVYFNSEYIYIGDSRYENKDTWNSYVKVQNYYNNFITVRDIIQSMIDSEHYKNNINHPQNVLEEFHKINDLQYIAIFEE